MFKSDAELVEKTIHKISKERCVVNKIPIIRWFEFHINKHNTVCIKIIYKFEEIEEERYVIINGNNISVSYITHVLKEDLNWVKNSILEKITESEW